MGELESGHTDISRTMKFFPIRKDDPRTLSKEQIDHFNERGYISPIDVFTNEEIGDHRAYFDDLMEKALAMGHDSYGINAWHLRIRGIYDLVVEPRILDCVQDLLGENLICWGTHYFCKMAGDTKRVSWHQDASYWPLSPTKVVTVWLAIDDADEANGAMKFIPGSHLHGHISFEASAKDEENVLDQTVASAESYGDDPVLVPLLAGQMELHSDLLLHSSEPNPSERRRCGLTMRFAPPDVKALSGGRWGVQKGWNRLSVIARGNDPTGHWLDNPRPTADDIPPKGWAP